MCVPTNDGLTMMFKSEGGHNGAGLGNCVCVPSLDSLWLLDM